MSDEEDVQQYLEAAAGAPVLTAHEERRLTAALAQGDQPLREALIHTNMRLVVSIARRYEDRGLSFADVLRAGHAGLERAIGRFDPSKGYRLSTYATWWIRQGITRAIAGGGTD